MKKLLIAGGDMRQIFCGKRLAEKFDIFTVGIDNDIFPEVTAEMRGKFDFAVFPVVPLDEKKNIPTPLFSGEISAEFVKSLLSDDAVVFSGVPNITLDEIFSGHDIITYMNREELSLKNAVPTAEGAVMLALEELPVTLNGLKILIVGLGRIGMSLVEILKGFGADITVSVRNARGAAKARIFGVKSVCTRDISGDYGLVFNTAPELVFTREVLEKFRDDTLFIDLASRPGGFDFNSASELGKKVLWALGLPGKTAPVTAGEAVAETIIENLSA